MSPAKSKEETKPEAPAEPTADDERDQQAAMAVLTRVAGKEHQLHAKIADVMQIAERIPKKGTAPQAMGGYPFVQVGDAADFIRRALGRRGVSMIPSNVQKINHSEHATSRGGIMTTVELVTTWTLTDSETNETAAIQSYGAGSDTGDKFSGKAMTSTMKYALLSGFLLSTGDDTEASDATDKTSSEVRVPAQSRGRTPAQGGRQAEQTKSQKQMIGDLLRQAGIRTTKASITLIEELYGKKIEIGDDVAASLGAFLDGLDANESGKLVHDLRKHVEKIEKDKAPDTKADADDATTGESNPGQGAGDEPDESLEAGSAL